MSDLAIYHPDQEEPEIKGWTSLPAEGEEDKVVESEVIHGLNLSPVILGCAPFGYGIYASREDMMGDVPLRVVRLALKSGVTAFDTAPWYHPSEIILGNCFHALRDEFPRESYQIITKTGKFGPKLKDHFYEPSVVRKSVERSLKRFKTDYLDIVYMHDVEFVCSPPHFPAGHTLEALDDTNRQKWGLVPPYEPLGKEDEGILAGLAELRKLKAEGKIRAVGMAGYPLATLLRLALLVLHKTGEPLDILQTYANQTIQNPALTGGYLKAFTVEAKVGLVTNAAPLAMGTLTTSLGPTWHPGRQKLGPSAQEAVEICKKAGRTLEDVACDFGFSTLQQDNGETVPVVVGCKNLHEVHLNLRSYARANSASRDKKLEDEVQEAFRRNDAFGWCWDERSMKVAAEAEAAN